MTKDEALAWAELSSADQSFDRAIHAPDLDSDIEPQRFLVLVHRRAGKALAARIRELEGRTCDRCSYCQFIDLDKEAAWCDYVEHFCDTMGNTCGAFREKDPS